MVHLQRKIFYTSCRSITFVFGPLTELLSSDKMGHLSKRKKKKRQLFLCTEELVSELKDNTCSHLSG